MACPDVTYIRFTEAWWSRETGATASGREPPEPMGIARWCVTAWFARNRLLRCLALCSFRAGQKFGHASGTRKAAPPHHSRATSRAFSVQGRQVHGDDLSPNFPDKRRSCHPPPERFMSPRRRVISSVGRALRLHRRCREFEPLITHHLPPPVRQASDLFAECAATTGTRAVFSRRSGMRRASPPSPL